MSRIRANKITNKLGTGAIELEKGAHLPIGMGITGAGGVNITGVVTAGSFSGDGSGLIGVASTDNIITGTAATFNNLVNVGSNIKIDATSGIVTATGVNVTGIVTATSFVGGAANLTGLPAGFSELDAALFN